MEKDLYQYLDTIVALQQQLIDILIGNIRLVDQDDWLDNADVKLLLKISDRTLYRLRSSGQLPAKKIGGKWFYPRKAVGLIINSVK